MYRITLLLLFISAVQACHGPGTDYRAYEPPAGNYRIRTVVFYNVENLFDTRNDTLVADEERTPGGRYNWTQERYEHKLRNLARTLSEVGREEALRLPDLVGLCEVENRQVLEDLVRQEALRPGNYRIVHYDSPDGRGIDVALLYRPSSFTPVETASRRLLIYDPENRRRYSRDQLVISGLLDGMPMYLTVNHWPSRSGGEILTDPYRREAAKLQRRIFDSLQAIEPELRFLAMGDLNDDPVDASLKIILGAKDHTDSLSATGLFNPMEALFHAGIGSLAYRDRWNLFDQVLLNGTWFNDTLGYNFWKAQVFRPDYLITREGPYKGYPFRTYAGGLYQGGYSDHFPVYALFVKRVGDRPTAVR